MGWGHDCEQAQSPVVCTAAQTVNMKLKWNDAVCLLWASNTVKDAVIHWWRETQQVQSFIRCSTEVTEADDSDLDAEGTESQVEAVVTEADI